MCGVSVTLADVERARPIVTSVVHRTPLLTSRSLGERIGANAYLKAENLQRTGSFKPRGAAFAVASLSKEQRERGSAAGGRTVFRFHCDLPIGR